MESILKNAQPQLIYTVMAASIVFLVLGSYLYIFKKPLIEYSKLKKTRILLQSQSKVESKTEFSTFSTNIERLRNNVDQFTKHLEGKNPDQLIHKIFAYTIDKLDNISLHHDIFLLSVKPGTIKNIPMFKEIPFDVEVAGQYLQLYEWLHEVEGYFASMVVKQFEIQSESGSKKLRMKMKMVSYRLLQEDK